ncbi:MAG: glycosyltransferase [Clostridia bacterium]|nr:glycosyltransferase [Clostridia bacterium]
MEKKKILIVSFDLEVGGIERSLLGLLEHFDYSKYDVDLMLYSHTGDFMKFLPDNGYRLLPEIPQYATFRKGIVETIKAGHPFIALRRIIAKLAAKKMMRNGVPEGKVAAEFCQVQKYWDYTINCLPKLEGEYDVAISFMWPHHFVAKKVNAKKKFAWIHSDYTKAFYDAPADEKIWNMFDKIVGVSEDSRRMLCEVLPSLEPKTTFVENLLSQEFVRAQANEDIDTSDMTVEDGEISLVSVGRLTHQKAFDVAAEVCRRIIDDGYKVKWFVIGYGSDEELIKSKAAEFGVSDKFILLGKKLNVYPYVKKADLYVQPSRYEGKAVTIREAQMLGKACVITNFPTAGSQVEDGVDAVICGMKVEEIARAVETLIDDTELRSRIESTAYGRDYGNLEEINKIYSLIEE